MSNPAGNPPPAAAPAPPARRPRQIRGPQSALTDFLASNNISATQITQTAATRRAAAAAAQAQATAAVPATTASDDEEDEPAPARKATTLQGKKRKLEQEKAIAKIKASKRFKARSKPHNPDDTSEDDEDEAARAIYDNYHAPLPGQMEDCEICEKRFTVTSYCRSGDGGKLLCPACSKKLDAEGAAKRKKKAVAGKKRRLVQSNLLDGIYPGVKSLVTLSMQTLANYAPEAAELTHLPDSLVDKLAALLSKKRLLTPETLQLFIRPECDSITVYDGAKLTPDYYIGIFQVVPNLKHLRLRNAVQFKNLVMDHLLATVVELESLSLHGANLIDDERWNRFLTEKGSHLKSLKVYWTDGHFGDDQLELLQHTTNLERLKIVHNQQITDEGLAHIAKLSTLKYLSLRAYKPTSSAPYIEILNSIGEGLRTFSLSVVNFIEDEVLTAIHTNCRNVDKLRITNNEVLTDAAFASLFTDWQNPPLRYIDLSDCRHMDAENPRNNPDGIGLGSKGFAALMAHSGRKLRFLDIHSCRHISTETFEEVFSATKVYPDLEKLNISFCQGVDDFVVGSIFKTCPNLKTLAVFGNFGVRDVRVPVGKILIGLPNAQGMTIEGTTDGEGRNI